MGKHLRTLPIEALTLRNQIAVKTLPLGIGVRISAKSIPSRNARTPNDPMFTVGGNSRAYGEIFFADRASVAAWAYSFGSRAREKDD